MIGRTTGGVNAQAVIHALRLAAVSCGLVQASALGAVPSPGHSADLISAWRTEEGLPHDVVRAIAEDRAGLVLIGTSAGLAGWRDGKLIRRIGEKLHVRSRIEAVVRYMVRREGAARTPKGAST